MVDFGRDVYCMSELRTGRYASGVALVAQRFYHALVTPRGSLCGDEHHANWGDDLTDVVGMPGGAEADARIRAMVNRAAANEPTIRNVTTTITSTQADDGTWTHAVTIDAATSDGPFELVFDSVADVTVAALGFPTEIT